MFQSNEEMEKSNTVELQIHLNGPAASYPFTYLELLIHEESAAQKGCDLITLLHDQARLSHGP